MTDEIAVEELSLRSVQQKMDDAFRAAMEKAINMGEENTPKVVSKKPGTKYPKVVVA